MRAEERGAVVAFRQFGRNRREQRGFGIGLAIVRNGVALYHGSFALDPGPLAVGVRASIELPLAT